MIQPANTGEPIQEALAQPRKHSDVPESGSLASDQRYEEGIEMATTEERMAILRMIEQGKISAEEGARLLAALDNREQEQSGSRTFDTSRHLRVRVTDLVTDRSQVNINLPLGLVQFGLRFVPSDMGIDVDAIHQAIQSGVSGCIVDVTDHEDNKRVEIFLE